jgi:hypothetical protein
VGDETASGHWLYAFLRRDSKTGQAFLVVAHFHGTETLRGVKVRIPNDARMFVGRIGDAVWSFADRLDSEWSGTATDDAMEHEGLALPDMPPCSALLLEIGRAP